MFLSRQYDFCEPFLFLVCPSVDSCWLVICKMPGSVQSIGANKQKLEDIAQCFGQEVQCHMCM